MFGNCSDPLRRGVWILEPDCRLAGSLNRHRGQSQGGPGSNRELVPMTFFVRFPNESGAKRGRNTPERDRGTVSENRPVSKRFARVPDHGDGRGTPGQFGGHEWAFGRAKWDPS